MENTDNFINRFKELTEYGGCSNYIQKDYNEEIKDYQKRIGSTNFTFNITTVDNVFNFITRDEIFNVELTDSIKNEIVKCLWKSFGNFCVDENDEIEEKYLHFEIGENREDIWNWFEWFFDIRIIDFMYRNPSL